MTSLNEIEKFALELPEPERAKLAAHLLDSLAPALDEDDDGLAEAIRRDAELDAIPNQGASLEEFDAEVSRRRAQ